MNIRTLKYVDYKEVFSAPLSKNRALNLLIETESYSQLGEGYTFLSQQEILKTIKPLIEAGDFDALGVAEAFAQINDDTVLIDME